MTNLEVAIAHQFNRFKRFEAWVAKRSRRFIRSRNRKSIERQNASIRMEGLSITKRKEIRRKIVRAQRANYLV